MHFDPHFEEVKGVVEPCWMARWKALAEFLLSVIELLFTKLDTFCYPTVQTASCYVPSLLTQYRRVTDGQTDGQTDRQTDGIAVASTALANCNASIARAVKTVIGKVIAHSIAFRVVSIYWQEDDPFPLKSCLQVTCSRCQNS